MYQYLYPNHLSSFQLNDPYKLDGTKRFRYTSNQGEFVKTLEIGPNIGSIIYYEEIFRIFFKKESAIILYDI